MSKDWMVGLRTLGNEFFPILAKNPILGENKEFKELKYNFIIIFLFIRKKGDEKEKLKKESWIHI
jgi:hypothetical protein